jgi:hypothetical protein
MFFSHKKSTQRDFAQQDVIIVPNPAFDEELLYFRVREGEQPQERKNI